MACVRTGCEWSAPLLGALLLGNSPALSCGLQVLEVLADDSNFRIMAMKLSAAPIAAMLTLLPEAFESAWCAGDAPCILQAVPCTTAEVTHVACSALLMGS